MTNRQPHRVAVDEALFRGRRSPCRFCPAFVVWARTERGSLVPLDVDGSEVLDDGRFSLVSHWATCTGAKRAAAYRDAKRARRERNEPDEPQPPAPRRGALPFDP